MSFKRMFYLPSFTSTAIDPSKMILSPCPPIPEPGVGYQNCIFEIDTRDFPNFSTIIQKHQSIYDESESLLSCYNIYSWQGFRVNKWIHPDDKSEHYIPVVSLKVEDYDYYHDLDAQCIFSPESLKAIDEKWLGSKCGEVQMSRLTQAPTLIHHLCHLWDSYERNVAVASGYHMTWLNTEFAKHRVSGFVAPTYNIQPTEDLLHASGEELNAAKFNATLRAQLARRQQQWLKAIQCALSAPTLPSGTKELSDHITKKVQGMDTYMKAGVLEELRTAIKELSLVLSSSSQ